MRLALLLLVLAGCASPFRYCVRQRYPAFNVMKCPDEAVGRHCAKKCKTSDDGKPLCYLPRACTLSCILFYRWKPLIVTGKSEDAMTCAFHEACHALNWGPPSYCENLYPCLGEGGHR